MDETFAEVIGQVRDMISGRKYPECRALISTLMFESPDAAVPHNLMGILLEAQGQHLAAMRHFRAAYDLDPTYAPAWENLVSFGSYAMSRDCQYGDESEKGGASTCI